MHTFARVMLTRKFWRAWVMTGCRILPDTIRSGLATISRFTRFGQPGQTTFLGTADKNLRIDYIFASAALAPQAADCVIWQAAGDEPSDHRPVVADFALEL